MSPEGTRRRRQPRRKEEEREREREKLGGGPSSSSLSIVVQTRKRPFFFSFSTPPPPHSPHYATYRLHHHPLFFLLGRQFKVQGMGVSSPTHPSFLPSLFPSPSPTFLLSEEQDLLFPAPQLYKRNSILSRTPVEMATPPTRTFSLSLFILFELSGRQHCNSPRNPSSTDPYVSFFPPSASAPFAQPSLPPY